jgi:hypothetical protein
MVCSRGGQRPGALAFRGTGSSRRAVVSGRGQVGARPATARDVEDLGVEPGTGVRYGRNWYLDEQGDVVEYGEYASEGDPLRSYEYLMGGG